ncbi:MAG: hypothetical protein KGJ14_01105 [Nitrospirota bacterium]|nr:hypothetical protein [Nitrospirota bacterium]
MRHHRWSVSLWLWGVVSLVVMAGCAGKGETVWLDLQPGLRTDGPAPKDSPELVLVEAFEDLRPEKGKTGLRTHLWGGVTYFDVPGGVPGAAVARLVGEYLARTGRQVTINVVNQPDRPGTPAATQGSADVTITGQVQELSVHAKSRFGSTEISAKFQVTVLARNKADGSTVRRVLEGARSKTVFWFEPEDVQALVNAMLTDSLNRLLDNVYLEGRSWRLKS